MAARINRNTKGTVSHSPPFIATYPNANKLIHPRSAASEIDSKILHRFGNNLLHFGHHPF